MIRLGGSPELAGQLVGLDWCAAEREQCDLVLGPVDRKSDATVVSLELKRSE